MSKQINRMKRADAFKVVAFVRELDMTQYKMQSLVEFVRESLKINVTAQSLRKVLVDAEMPMPSKRNKVPSRSKNNADRLVVVATALLRLMRELGKEVPPELKAVAYRTSTTRIVEGRGKGEAKQENVPLNTEPGVEDRP